MKRVRLIVVASVSALIFPLSAQQTQDPPSGVISGTLTSADLGRPIRKAQVRLVSFAPRMTRTTASDANGRYVFDRLPAGEYTISATKAGFLEMVLGARRPGAGVPGTRLMLAAGQKLENLSLALPRGGVISGIVTDEFGDPAMGVTVRVLRFGYANGHRMAQPAGSAITDDIGQYRVGGLLPGEYVVSAVPRDSVARAAAEASRRAQVAAAAATAGERARTAELSSQHTSATLAAHHAGYVPSYFGGTPSPSSAGRIRLGLSEHAGGIDIPLVSLSTGTVSGIVTDPSGRPVSASVQLIDPLMPIANMTVWFRHPGADGRFTFEGMLPGSYVLRAQGNRPIGEVRGSAFTAAADVHIPEGAAVDAPLRLHRGVSVSGTLDVEAVTSIDPQRLRIELQPIPGPADWEAAAPRVTPNASGRFVLPNVVPGAYRVRVSGLPNGWRLASAMFGEVDAADVNLVVATEPISGGMLSVTSQSSSVAGTVSNTTGEPVSDRAVIIFAAERELWVADSRRILVVQPSPDGRFSFRELPAGHYRLAAIDPPESGQQFDPEFLASLVSGSTDVTLGAGEVRTQNLSVR